MKAPNDYTDFIMRESNPYYDNDDDYSYGLSERQIRERMNYAMRGDPSDLDTDDLIDFGDLDDLDPDDDE